MRQMLRSSSDLIWYNAGEHAGEGEGIRLKKAMTKMGPEGFLHLMTDLYTNLGWGKTTFRNLDLSGRSVTILTKSNPLTREVASAQPVCHYIKGFYRGFCTVVFQSDNVTVEEAACEATGAARCEFRIRW
jgi:predicted hydrocarbon binding protein